MKKILNGKEVDMKPAEVEEHNARQTAMAAEDVERAKVAYIQKRRDDYPDIHDQLDVIWKAFAELKRNGILLPAEADEMLTDIAAVKTLHPKP